MTKLIFLFSALAAGLLAGCATYHPQAIDPANTQAQQASRTLDDAGLHTFLAENGHPIIADWDLDNLTLAAFYFSPALDGARAEYEAAKAGVVAARSLPNPSLNFTPGYNVDSGVGITPWILDYTLNLPLELGQRKNRAAETSYQQEISRLSLASKAWSVRVSLRQALIELRSAEKALDLWRKQKPILAEARELLEVQVRIGELSSFEASQDRMAFTRSTLEIHESERLVQNAIIRIAEVIGVPPASLESIGFSYQLGESLDSPAVEPAEARNWAAVNRLDLLAALASYSAGESALHGEIIRQFPDLSIGPGYQLDQGEGKWSLSLGFTLPVFNRNAGPIAAAQARRNGLAAQFLELQNRVLAEVNRAAVDMTAAQADMETVRSLHSEMSQQVKVSAAQYASGEISRIELARAQIELADFLRTELETTKRSEQAVVAFEDAVQRPLALPDTSWSIAPRRQL